MTTSFEKYSDILLEAYQSNSRSDELGSKKKEILDKIFSFYNLDVTNTLFIGFSPALLKFKEYDICVTQISDAVRGFLTKQMVSYTYVDFDRIKEKQFKAVIAFDEYFTFAESDEEQRELVKRLVSLSNKFVLTTLKDYKNQDFKEKEFSNPIALKDHNESKKIFFEHYEYNQPDRNNFLATNYIVDDESVMLVGPFCRRAMYFKQLAKFGLDAGARNFLVHKNLMYKSVVKKNYEHIITIEI
jgi:hypothetical protein